MELKTVKIKGQGYLLNGTMLVPKADGNREYELIKEWLSEGNTPEPEFTEEELNEQRIQAIKSKASELITSKYSIVWQLNHPRTDSRYINEYAWIDDIRAISNQAEIEGTNLEDIQWQ